MFGLAQTSHFGLWDIIPPESQLAFRIYYVRIMRTRGNEVSPFPAVDHKAHINRRAQNIANTRQNKNIKDPQKKYRLGTVSKIFYWRA